MAVSTLPKVISMLSGYYWFFYFNVSKRSKKLKTLENNVKTLKQPGRDKVLYSKADVNNTPSSKLSVHVRKLRQVVIAHPVNI